MDKEVIMEEHKKKAFDGALDLTKQLITLSTGTLVLTATFIKDILQIGTGQAIPHKSLLCTTWGLMLFSILCGLLAHGAITGTLDGADINDQTPGYRLSPFNFNIRIWAVSQCVIFFLGILFLIIYVAKSL